MIVAEFVTTAPLADYQRGMVLELTDATRYVGLTASCHGPPGVAIADLRMMYHTARNAMPPAIAMPLAKRGSPRLRRAELHKLPQQ